MNNIAIAFRLTHELIWLRWVRHVSVVSQYSSPTNYHVLAEVPAVAVDKSVGKVIHRGVIVVKQARVSIKLELLHRVIVNHGSDDDLHSF